MTGTEFKAALQQLHLTQAAFGEWVGVHPVTSKTWTRKGPPRPVAKWVKFLLARKMTPSQIDELVSRH
jgi:hypothetical protein